MKTETAPVRLADYRAPDFAIETVDLDFRLDPHATLVTSRLAMRPANPGAPLVLDGDELTLKSLAIDGTALATGRYTATPDKLTIAEVPDKPFTLEIVTEIDPTANTKLMGLFRSSGTWCTQCEAEGFRRITYFLDRPDVLAVYTTRIEAAKDAAPVLLSNGNLTESGDIAGSDRHFAVWHDPFPKPSYLFALVAGDLGVIRDSFTTMSGRRGGARRLLRARQGGALRLGDGFAQALHALGRDRLRPRIRSRRVQHRRRVRFQHGGDGEQGPQHLQRQIRARRPGHRHRFRLRLYRGRDRPRIFPQLDRRQKSLAATGSSSA